MSTAVVPRRVDGPPAPAPAPRSFALATVFEQRRADIVPLLPKGVTLDRVISELYLACRRTPDLEKVPGDLLIDAVGRALATEGIIDQDVYLVPFFSKERNRFEPTVMIDYKYKVEMVVAAGGARSVEVRAVYAKEPFAVHYGTESRIEHQPLPPNERGALRGAYAIAKINAWTVKFEWMELADIEVIRAKSKPWGPNKFQHCPPWYAKKTVVHQLVKLLPKSPRLRAIAKIVDDEDAVEFGRPDVLVVEDDDRPNVVPEADVTPSDDAPPVEDMVSLKDAQDCKVNGKPLGTLRNSGVRAILAWAEEKLEGDDPEPRFAWIADCCRRVLLAREKGHAEEPPKKFAADSADVLGAGNVGPVLPGELEGMRADGGELALNDAPATRNAVREGR